MTSGNSTLAASIERSQAWSVTALPRLAGWVLLALVFGNTWWYAQTTANPLVASDAWYFVETFLPRALDGTVGLADIYAKRDGFDHAQPLHKLFLMFNARYLGLDFTYEALVGVLAGIAGVLVLKRLVDRECAERGNEGTRWLALAAIAAVFLSLNSSTVFTWPLVAFGYVTTLVLLLAIALAWSAWRRRAYALFAVAMGICAALTDDSGLLLSVALAATFFWVGWRERQLRAALVFGAVGIGTTVLYASIYAAFDPVVRGDSPVPGEHLSKIFVELQGAGGWRILIPFASAIAFYGQLETWFGTGWERAQCILGIAMLVGHAIFWWKALRRVPGPATFAAIALMLLFYGYVAGIVYGRVPDMGLRYLNEPRYAVLYGLQLVAMLTLVASRSRGPVGAHGRKRMAAAEGLAVAVLILQVALSVKSWKERPYEIHYSHSMASEMLRLGREPWRTPRGCPPMLVVCEWHPVRRKVVIDLLERYHLNVFSDRFRARHHFDA